ncbi:MAG TPA: APC family permease [Candidatus Dormibacteraeota bacterium]|nr:APC family permease [Candidatus Dormibacteraeota bacterium]
MDAAAGATPEANLDAMEAHALREAGHAWSEFPTTGSVDPDLRGHESRGLRIGDRYVRGVRPRRQGFEPVAPGMLQATAQASAPPQGLALLMNRLRHALIGAPLASSQAVHERLTKVKALAVLSSDALSSVAYATEQILVVLAAAGAVAYGALLPIMGATLALLAVVVLSYRQTIKAYPRGGGSYIVASDNLGHLAGLVAGCALMTSYTLTVAVSVASGVDAIISAAPGMEGLRVQLCVAFTVLLLLGNLRGIRESGNIFSAPTYLFILGMFAMVVTLGVRLLTGSLHGAPPHIEHVTQSLTLFLVLRAFASGATALTGVEAISDGVPAFKPPEWVNARTTLTVMGLLLGLMFLGITLATHALGVVPEDASRPGYETVISQLAHSAFGSGLGYLYIAITTTGILVLAGNTAFSDFPRLLFFMARDDYAPHQFKRLGDRLAYSNGIVLLAALAILLLVGFHGQVSRLIPLYAVGVFTAFTMSQAGMVARWLRLREQGWRQGLPLNILGTATTSMVLLVTGVFNLTRGAWIIVVIVPLLVLVCRAVNRHYRAVWSYVAAETPTAPGDVHLVCVVPIAGLNAVALQSLALARGISDTMIAVHVNDNLQEIADLRARWQAWGNRVPLEIIDSPYRSLVRPLLTYVAAIQRQRHDATVVVVLPELVATRWWHQVLHNQNALRLKAALLFRPGIVTVNVPYHLRQREPHRAHHEDEAL